MYYLIMRFILILLFTFSVSPTAFAQESQAIAPTRIEVDQDANVIRIIIEGHEVAQFTSSGLLVPGDINFGGTIRDGGGEQIKQEMKANSKASQADVNGKP